MMNEEAAAGETSGIRGRRQRGSRVRKQSLRIRVLGFYNDMTHFATVGLVILMAPKFSFGFYIVVVDFMLQILCFKFLILMLTICVIMLLIFM
jgi:hypothetical protein